MPALLLRFAPHLLIAAALAWGCYALWSNGYNRAERECQAAALRSELAAVRKDLAAEKQARAEDQIAIGELAAEKQKAESANDTLRDEIKKLPLAEQCIVPPDRARRMR